MATRLRYAPDCARSAALIAPRPTPLGPGDSMLSASPRTRRDERASVAPEDALAAGQDFTCAVIDNGLKCSGKNQHGQLGDGTMRESASAVVPVGMHQGVVTVAAGYSHACALLNTHALKCWGKNEHGQLGNGTTGDSGANLVPMPVRFEESLGFLQDGEVVGRFVCSFATRAEEVDRLAAVLAAV